MIPVRGVFAQYLLLEKEQISARRLNAIVLQQFPDKVPGARLAYQIDCQQGPAWNNNTEAQSLMELRRMSVGDQFLRTRDDGDADQQIAVWLCG
jgi:hypothetical protein